MKIPIVVLSLLLLNACQSSNNAEASKGVQENSPTLKQLIDNLPMLGLPATLDKSLLGDYPGQEISFELAPKLSSPMELKEVRAIAQIKGFEQQVFLLYYAFPTDSEVDDYDQMALVTLNTVGDVAEYLALDVGGTGFASTQTWIKEDGEVLTAVIAEMEEVEVEVKTYQLTDGKFTEHRQLSKTFQDGSYQKFLDEI